MDIIVMRLKELRAQHGLTQQQLAFDTGLSIGGIQSIETGRAKPNIETLAKLADRYGCTTDYLLGRTDDPKETVRQVTWNEMRKLADRVIAVAERFETDEAIKIRNMTAQMPKNDDTISEQEHRKLLDILDASITIIEKKAGIDDHS